MNNREVREEIAKTAESRIGFNKFDLGYVCEETCAEGVSDVLRTAFNEHDIEGLCTSYSCNTMYADMTDSEYWYEPEDYMERGDIIFFDWDHAVEEKPLDHVGIVLRRENGIVTYANINGSSHTVWTTQTMNMHNTSIAYWLRYINPTPETNTQNMDENSKALELRMTIEKCKNALNELLILLND